MGFGRQHELRRIFLVAVLWGIGGEGEGVAQHRHTAEPERARSEGGPVVDSVDLGVVPMTAERRHWDQWRGTQFTDAEILKLIMFMERVSAGCDKIDGRILPKECLKFLLRWHYLEKTKHGFIVTALARGQYGN